MKIITFFHVKITIFTSVKNCSILHGRVCVMGSNVDGWRDSILGFIFQTIFSFGGCSVWILSDRFFRHQAHLYFSGL